MRTIKRLVFAAGVLSFLAVTYVLFVLSYAVSNKVVSAWEYTANLQAMRAGTPAAHRVSAPEPIQPESAAAVPVAPTDTPAPPTAVPQPEAHYATANLLPWKFRVTSQFGHYPSGGAHYGMDLDATYGVAQTFPVGGTVTQKGTGCVEGNQACNSGWGNHVWWRTDPNTLGYPNGVYVLLAHFSSHGDYNVGDRVEAGQLAGITGSTGYSSGPHVHFQRNPDGMMNSGSANPAWLFPWLRDGDNEPLVGDRFGASD